MTPFDFILIALATWRLSYMLTGEDCPFGICRKFRERFPLGGLMTCIYCLSVWVAALWVVVYLYTPLIPLVWVFALSGAALMLRSYTGAGVHDV